MQIKSVQYITHHESPDENGELIPVTTPHFRVTREDDSMVSVPVDPGNSDYWEVKSWYEAQNPKPFDFVFEDLPEPMFEESESTNEEELVEG